MKQLTLRLQRAGVELMAGSDTPVQFCPPGGALLQELELLAEAGLTPAEALRAATRNNARALGQTADLGSIEVGKIADLVILSSDPLADIRHTRDIHRVIHGGRVLDPAELVRQVPVR
jgi:imidazolonepropionase-like amidohydrolase